MLKYPFESAATMVTCDRNTGADGQRPRCGQAASSAVTVWKTLTGTLATGWPMLSVAKAMTFDSNVPLATSCWDPLKMDMRNSEAATAIA